MEKWVRPAGSPAIEFEASYDPRTGITYGCEGIGYPYESIVPPVDWALEQAKLVEWAREYLGWA